MNVESVKMTDFYTDENKLLDSDFDMNPGKVLKRSTREVHLVINLIKRKT